VTPASSAGTNGCRELAKQHEGLVPSHAPVGDALTVRESLRVGEILASLDEERLDHDADDAGHVQAAVLAVHVGVVAERVRDAEAVEVVARDDQAARPVSARFFENLRESSLPELDKSCWLWAYRSGYLRAPPVLSILEGRKNETSPKAASVELDAGPDIDRDRGRSRARRRRPG